MPDDVVLNKAAVIERCVARARQEYAGDDSRLFDNITAQDSIILNLLRACEAAIGLAMHLIRRHHLGVPQESRSAFEMLANAGYLDAELAQRMMRMVAFRNVAINDYQKLNLDIVRSILNRDIEDFLDLTQWAIKHAAQSTND